jgi:hypothetical protein
MEQQETKELQINEKRINQDSFVMDINAMKIPFFEYTNYKPELDENGKKKAFEEKENQWIDSKNIKRRFYKYCKGRLPRQFEQDVYFGLMRLFVYKNAPFDYNVENSMYDFNVSKVEFSFYELCHVMKVPYSTYYVDKCRDAIKLLKQTQYFSYENGVLYDKKIGKYMVSGETGISLLNAYKFKRTKKSDNTDDYADIDNNWVEFSSLILDNIKYEYMKFLEDDFFFGVLPSGIERGIYTYLESNRYDSNNNTLKYVKRSYEVLRIGIPVEFDFPYILKRKLKPALNHLIEIGYIKDYIFGDELRVNEIKDEFVYFCFEITKEELKRILEKKKPKQLQINLDSISKDELNNVSKVDFLSIIPNQDLKKELINKGITIDVVEQLVKNNDKWDIIKYIMWFNQQVSENKFMSNPPGLLRIAIEKKLPIESGYQEIVDYINKYRQKEQNDYETKQLSLEEQYKIYISDAIEEFVENEKEVYDLLYQAVLNDLTNSADNRLRQLKSVGSDVSKIEKFIKTKDESEWFKEMLNKEIITYKKLKTFEEFKHSNL